MRSPRKLLAISVTSTSIGYHSTKPPSLGGYRTVHVEASAPNHGKLDVRTRRGYYPKITQSTPTVADSEK